jgi:hypothetical protein
MELNFESFNEKSGVYFITDSAHSHVRIGESANTKFRLMEHSSSRGKSNTILLYFLECSNHLEVEKATHNYFKKYRIPEETNSFYSSEIIPLLEKYVSNSGFKVNTRTMVTDLWGEKTNLKESRPRCAFFPEQTAHVVGRAGTGEKYRTYVFKGKKVYVSSKFHELLMEIKREFRQEVKPNGNNLNQYITTEENNLDHFLHE